MQRVRASGPHGHLKNFEVVGEVVCKGVDFCTHTLVARGCKAASGPQYVISTTFRRIATQDYAQHAGDRIQPAEALESMMGATKCVRSWTSNEVMLLHGTSWRLTSCTEGGDSMVAERSLQDMQGERALLLPHQLHRRQKTQQIHCLFVDFAT